MSVVHSKKKLSLPANSGTLRSSLWWYERREDLARLSAHLFAKKHRCNLEDAVAYKERFSEVEFVEFPSEKGSKTWWERHFEELNFLSVSGFALLYGIPFERVELKKELLIRKRKLKKTGTESRGSDFKNSANFLWLEVNRLDLDELSRQEFRKEYVPVQPRPEDDVAQNDEPADLDSFPPYTSTWWIKHLSEFETLSLKEFCVKYNVALPEIERHIRYLGSIGKLEKRDFVNFYRQALHPSDKLRMLAHLDNLEKMSGDEFREAYQITRERFYYLTRRLRELGVIDTLPRLKKTR